MTHRAPSPRWRRRLWIAAGIVGLFTFAGFVVAPPLLHAQLEKRLSAALGRSVTIGKVRFNPYTLAVTIERLDVAGREAGGTFVGWDRLYVNFDALASFGGDWVLGAIELDGLRAAAALEADGQFDFAGILEKISAAESGAPAPAAAPAEPPRPVRVTRLNVTNAQIAFADRSRGQPFATTLGPLTFELKEFRTVPKRGAPYHFLARTEAGEQLEWTGTLAMAPFRSEGTLALTDIALPKYAAYYADVLLADLVAGRLSMRARYHIDLSADAQALRLEAGELKLQDLRVNERGTQTPALELASFDITGAQFDAVTLAARIASVRATHGRLHARREADGRINWESFFPPPAAPQSPGETTVPPAAERELPAVHVGEIALENFSFAFDDLTTPRPARLALQAVGFSLRDVTLADGAEMPVQLEFDWLPEGHLSTRGALTLRPAWKVEVQTELQRFAMLPLSPYLEQQVDARFTQGFLSTQNTLTAAPAAAGGVAAHFVGSVRVEEIGLIDAVHREPLAGFGALELNGIKAETAPALALALESIVLRTPYARVIRHADGSLNLAGLVRTPPPADATTPVNVALAAQPAQQAAAEPLISIGRVEIEGGDFSFSDRSLTPEVRFALAQFGGRIGGISSAQPLRGEVDLRGSLDGVGPVAISGQLDPFGTTRFVDLKVDFKNVDLLPLSPYSGKFAGYELARGKLALDVKARVDGERLQSENVLTLHQFTFGAPVSSPDATGLPVRLGVALLKDVNGQIVIDVPVAGELTDPNFRVGRVVMRVIVNLLTKAAMSPFSLLGSMFGGGGDELAFQEFEPGSSELSEASRAKLETLIKALNNRPALSLGIEGNTDGPADTFALQRARVAERVRAEIWEARRRTDPNQPPPDRLTITPEEYLAQVKALFDAKFPPGTEFGTPLPAAPEVVTPPAPPRSLTQRVGRALTLAEMRERRAAAKENARRAEAHAEAVAAAVAAGVPLEDMVGRLAETIEISPDELRALAESRAARVRHYFVENGGIDAERLFLTQSAGAQKENKGPRVFFTLQ